MSWVRPVLEEGLEGSWKHLLEANNQDAVGGTVCNHVAAHEQTSRASRAVVVDVVNGDLGHAKLVEDALTAGAVTVAVASNTLLDIVVVDVSIQHGLDTSLETELIVVDLATGLDELGHTHTQDIDGTGGLLHHLIGG